MNNHKITTLIRAAARAVMLAAFALALAAPAAFAQTTSGGTVISNTASASYSDGTNSYTTVSNTVTVTVANVSGLAITPDAGSVPTVVAGQNNVDFTFTVTNTSNFANQVRFLASGASVQTTGPVTVTGAFIDTDLNGIDAGDTDIFANASDVLSATIARNATLTVIVRVNVQAAAASGAAISVRLGDSAAGGPSFDNQTATNSANEVRTSVPSGTTAPVNGESEARGDITTSVENDAQLRLNVNYPAGPVALGSNITYTWTVQNTGARAVTQQTLAGAPAGSNTGVFVVAPVPVNTTFVSVTPPAGVTMLYTTSSLSNDPLGASTVWTTTAPASGVTRVAFNTGASLAVGASVTNMQFVVQVNTGINASNPIWEIGDAFGRNTVNAGITDQSEDAVSNKGDGNANFNEPRLGIDAATATQGFQVPTTLAAVGSVLIGPVGFPAAVGPTNNNDDYTNRTTSAASFAGVAPGGATVAASTVDFVNTVQNTGNANDTFTLSAPTVPAGFTVSISTDGGTNFIVVSGGGSTTLAVAFGASANIIVRVAAPTGQTVLTGFNTVIRAASANTPASTNETIDRLYTGFLRLVKSVTVVNATGVGGATDAVPGADIVYTITYTNVSSSGGTNNVTLTASNVVINEDGDSAPNNWATYTAQVTSPAPTDSTTGTITDGDTNGAVTATTTFLRDSIPSLAPGASGTFVFRRRIN